MNSASSAARHLEPDDLSAVPELHLVDDGAETPLDEAPAIRAEVRVILDRWFATGGDSLLGVSIDSLPDPIRSREDIDVVLDTLQADQLLYIRSLLTGERNVEKPERLQHVPQVGPAMANDLAA